MKKIFLLVLLAISMTEPVLAADIARGVRVGSNAPDIDNGGYFETGFGIGFFKNPRSTNIDKNPKRESMFFEVVLNGAYRYNGFFIEAAQQRARTGTVQKKYQNSSEFISARR